MYLGLRISDKKFKTTRNNIIVTECLKLKDMIEEI